jgi:hypothetical protein
MPVCGECSEEIENIFLTMACSQKPWKHISAFMEKS